MRAEHLDMEAEQPNQGIRGTVMVWQEPREGKGIDHGAGAGGRGLGTVAFGDMLGGCRI